MKSNVTIDELKEMFHKGEIEIVVGINEKKQTVIIAPTKTGFKLSTGQDNGWMRHNEFYWVEEHDDGYWEEEETYEKRWPNKRFLRGII